jgi:hypothetical protein
MQTVVQHNEENYFLLKRGTITICEWWFDFKLEQIFDKPQLTQKIKLASKVAKVDSKIIISLPKI